MDKFIVSARKYRPQTFDTVVGQAHITTTLKNAIKHQQLAHAFLFCGPRGVGKTTCARILAKTINCENPSKDGEACNKCQSCQSFNEGASMNYFELDGASNNKVEDMHELLASVRVRPGNGNYKVYVIDEVHMLTTSAFNAFLKTLEEPPPYIIFILATTEKHKILPTILSRCQIFDFKRITTDDTVEHLEEICKKEHIKAEKAALQTIAQKSEGCMRDALSILDKIVSFTNGELNYANTLEHLNILDADYYFRLMECMRQQDLSGAMLLYDDINQKGFEGDLVLNGFAEFIRNLLVCKDEKAASLLDVVESFRDKYMEMATKVETPLLISALNILNNAEINYKAARNKKLHVELALIRLCYLQQAVELAGHADISKKKVAEAARPIAFRQITTFSTKEIKSKKVTGEAKLVIDSSYAPTPAEVREEKADYTQPTTAQPVKTGKLSALDKIRNQYKESNGNANNDHNHPLELQILQNAWAEYVKKLKTVKNPAAQSFELAILRINDESSFEAVTANSIEKQFIEQERNSLFDFLQKKLKNKLLQFSVIIEEKNEERPQTEQTLSAKEQYLKLAEQYPAIKELKDRLKLELDY